MLSMSVWWHPTAGFPDGLLVLMTTQFFFGGLVNRFYKWSSIAVLFMCSLGALALFGGNQPFSLYQPRMVHVDHVHSTAVSLAFRLIYNCADCLAWACLTIFLHRVGSMSPTGSWVHGIPYHRKTSCPPFLIGASCRKPIRMIGCHVFRFNQESEATVFQLHQLKLLLGDSHLRG